MIAKTLRHVLISAAVLLLVYVQHADPAGETAVIPREMLIDKIRGGLLGQIVGDLNGLKHEARYIDEPGTVTAYTPALPAGAWTDDDTDFEWVYIWTMQRENTLYLSSNRIADLWIQRINRRIWCSNQFARQLMDLGLKPPLTGRRALNPWAEFNISGQFLCETFGLISPGMPQTAARIGLNYTQVAIDGEPAQTTQLFTSMISTAFLTEDINRIIDAGVSSLDPSSVINQVIADVRDWHSQNPRDWRRTRLRIKEKYSRHGGAMRDKNGYELNTASIIGALLHGRGDFIETLTMAFNFGWDADCNAATAGTIVGVIKGYRWMMSQGWQIVDRYENRTRDGMPKDETITSFADRLVELAERVITDEGGALDLVDGSKVCRIRLQQPRPVAALPDFKSQVEEMRAEMRPAIENTLLHGSGDEALARAAYLAICLDLAPEFKSDSPDRWKRALQALNVYWNVVQAVYHHSPVPLGESLREKADAAGLEKPAELKKLWN